MIHIIINQTAKTNYAMKTWQQAEAYLKSNHHSYTVYETLYVGHARELASAISQKDDLLIDLIVIGGDGTINEVVNGIEDFEKIRLGVIPNGSGNDFCGGLGIGEDTRHIIRHIMQRHAEKNCKKIDLGHVTYDLNHKTCERRFAVSSGFGMDASVTRNVNRSSLKKVLNRFHLGKLAYLLMTVYTLFSMTTADLSVSYRKQGQKQKSDFYKKLIFIAAMNLRAEGGGIPMAPDATPYDGMLSFGLASGIPKFLTFLALPFLAIGKQSLLPAFKEYSSDRLELLSSVPMSLHTDGEYLGEVSHVIFQCEAKKLSLLNL